MLQVPAFIGLELGYLLQELVKEGDKQRRCAYLCVQRKYNENSSLSVLRLSSLSQHACSEWPPESVTPCQVHRAHAAACMR